MFAVCFVYCRKDVFVANQEEERLKKRFLELSHRADTRGIYTYTDFLGLHELDLLMQLEREWGKVGMTLYGGAEGCERVMARFGTEENCGYAEAFPLVVLEARPKQQKYADTLTHRDLLGAIMALGVERDQIGDIFLQDNVGYLICSETASRLLLQEFTKARHTDLSVRELENLPEGIGTKREEKTVLVSSERLDAIVAAVYAMSREKSQALFDGRKVYVDGRLCEQASRCAVSGQTISVRGSGKFLYCGVQAESRKGKRYVRVECYV